MKRSQLTALHEYFERYINMTDDVELLDGIQKSIDELDTIPIQKWKALGSKVYAPSKWTINEIIQHLIDAERIFSYRVLAFSRGETQKLPSFDEDEYAKASNANNRSLESLIDELKIVHFGLYTLFHSFTPEMLAITGQGFKGPYSIASIGFMLPGHQRWHFKVIEERYMPLL